MNTGPFKANLEIIEKKTNIKYFLNNDEFYTNSNNANLVMSLSRLESLKEYIVTFYLDGNLVYKKEYNHAMELPF